MGDIKIILASKSPRRQQLVKELGFPFEVRTKEIEEIYPAELDIYQVPIFLAELKSHPFLDSLTNDELLLTSDTVVIHNNEILGKPADEADAFKMLNSLSGKMHEVITGVNLRSNEKSHAFSCKTEVYFSDLSTAEIEHYVTNYQPFDKAGAYGIQEWIGYIGVHKLVGCYYNVMGLPVHDIYHAIKKEFLVE